MTYAEMVLAAAGTLLVAGVIALVWIIVTNLSYSAVSRHPGETHRTAPTTAAGVALGATSRLLGPGASSAEQLSPQAGVEPAREIVVTIPVEDPPDCPCSACEGARMSFGQYQTGA